MDLGAYGKIKINPKLLAALGISIALAIALWFFTARSKQAEPTAPPVMREKLNTAILRDSRFTDLIMAAGEKPDYADRLGRPNPFTPFTTSTMPIATCALPTAATSTPAPYFGPPPEAPAEIPGAVTPQL